MRSLELKFEPKLGETQVIRLDQFVAANSELSRIKARDLIAQGGVYINRKRCHKNSRLVKSGQLVHIILKANTKAEAKIELSQKQIVFENSELIVVNKAAGIPSMPTLDNSRSNLFALLKKFLMQRDKLSPKQVYLGAHHRLDRDTSGLIMFTKSKKMNAPIAKAFQERTIHKKYYALVEGELTEPDFEIRRRIAAHPKRKNYFRTVANGGKLAISRVHLVKQFQVNDNIVSFVEVEILSGRTHQIRVHLSSEKHPILGDYKYGATLRNYPRPLLHASTLQWKNYTWNAPLPADFSLAIPALKAYSI